MRFAVFPVTDRQKAALRWYRLWTRKGIRDKENKWAFTGSTMPKFHHRGTENTEGRFFPLAGRRRPGKSIRPASPGENVYTAATKVVSRQ
jgi:hypothetical protein